MKEPWKKISNGKVVITLNDEKATPTEVEVPVDLNWTNGRVNEKRFSASKAVILMGVVLVLGLTIVTLFKVQNLVYSASYVNWRMQELESAVSDSSDDMKLMKYKLDEFIIDEKNDEIASAKGARAEALVASIGGAKNSEVQDLKLSESQNQNHKLNTVNSEPVEAKKESENSGKDMEKTEPAENKNTKESELNDGKDQPNPADPEEWIKPLVETFDIFGSQPIEDHFIHNVLTKLLMPENKVEVVELNKMDDREADNQKLMPKQEERINRLMPLPLDSILMKTLLPPISNFKIIHFNEKPEQNQQQQQQQQQQQNSMEEEMMSPRMAIQNLKFKQMIPPFDNIFKSLLPPTNMKVFHFNDKQEQSAEEDMPKITIQSIKLKLLPLPPQDEYRREISMGNNNNNFEVIRLNETPEPSQEVEAPKPNMPIASFNPFPIPIQDILMKTILPTSNMKNIEIVPLNERQSMEQQQHQETDMSQQEKFNTLPIPLQDIVMKTFMLPAHQSGESHYNPESQPHPDVEVTKVPVRQMQINPFPLPIPEALMKSMIPLANYEPEPEPQQPQENQQQEHQQQQQQQNLPDEVPRAMARSTKLNPVEEAWDMSPPPQPQQQPQQQQQQQKNYPSEVPQN